MQSVVSSCTGTQRNETLPNCITTPCMDMKTIGIPPCTGTPGQPHAVFSHICNMPIHGLIIPEDLPFEILGNGAPAGSPNRDPFFRIHSSFKA